jgi:hypothetical protein
VNVHGDGHVGTGDAAQPTPDASHRFGNFGLEIALCVDLLCHAQDLLRAGVDAQLASLALIFFDHNV